MRLCAANAAAELERAEEAAAAATAAVDDRLGRVDEAHKAALAELGFKMQRNLQALQEGLRRCEEHADEGLRLLEQHCAHQLQHGLDALGANLEHLLDNAVALEAMARTDPSFKELAEGLAANEKKIVAELIDCQANLG